MPTRTELKPRLASRTTATRSSHLLVPLKFKERSLADIVNFCCPRLIPHLRLEANTYAEQEEYKEKQKKELESVVIPILQGMARGGMGGIS